MDYLVNLYSRRLDALGARVNSVPATIRVALPPELHLIQHWVGAEFSQYWVSEVTIAMAHKPPRCLVAIIDGQLVGFACHDATARGFFGPTGVSPAHRGKGIGQALLFHALMAMKARGYAYAVIGAVGPGAFYENAVGAVPIASDGEDIYKGLLRIRPQPEPEA
ncbi:MAG: GNAT family N-acetyltransferase [Devosia sp.]